VAAFSCGWNYTSARFRVRQFIPDLAEMGIDVHESIAPIYKHFEPRWPGRWRNRAMYAATEVARPVALLPSVIASHRYDASWIQKEMIWGRDSLERFTRGPRLLDVDDAIWAETPHSRRGMASLAGHVDMVLAGNENIADWFSAHAREVRIIYTAVDTDLFEPPSSGHQPDRPFTIVWTGQKVTLYHLEQAEPALSTFMRRHPDVRFQSISDVEPPLGSLPQDRVTWYPWSPEVEVARLQDADVGIMPLVDNENGRGKCAFKMLQYMACGIASVVTPIGMNRDVLAMGEVGLGPSTTADWIEAFEQLYADREATRRMGAEGRRLAVERFARQRIASDIAGVFKEAVG
jgi:glycosyltransferase involved in cell wall biosynthesis